MTEIPLLPGSSSALRTSASHLRCTVAELDTARRAAARVEAVTGGEHWRGEGFDAFRELVERKPLTAAVDRARDRMEQAAAELDRLAARFDESQQVLHWCRSRLAALGPDDPGVTSERESILRDAERAWDDYRVGLGAFADLCDWLDDEPVFATPPPSTLERVASGVGSLAAGVVEGTVDIVVGVAEIAMILNPVLLPLTLQRAWNNREEIAAVLRFARDNPLDFAAMIGTSIIDLDTLREDPARWIGRRIPDILATIATGGLGRVGTTAAASARAVRGARVADAVVDHAGLLDRAGPFARPARTAGDVVDGFHGASWMGRLNRLDADPTRLVGAEGAAFTRADTALGGLGRGIDGLGPEAAALRQLPGRINDEIRGFTAIPARLLDGGTGTLSTSLGQRMFDGWVTNGWTSRLGMADGLLVGGPALSPATQATMGGVLLVDGFDTLHAPLDIYSDVSAGVSSELRQELGEPVGR